MTGGGPVFTAILLDACCDRYISWHRVYLVSLIFKMIDVIDAAKVWSEENMQEKVKVKWNRGFTPEILIEKLSALRFIDGHKVSFSGFEYFEYIPILQSMIEVDEGIAQEAAHRLIIEGFHEAAKKPNLTESLILNSVKKAVRDYLKKPKNKYWLITSLNVSPDFRIPDQFVNDCSICFLEKLPKKYGRPRDEIIQEASSWLANNEANLSCHIVASTHERSPHEAVEKILNSIDFLRGIWNLHRNSAMTLSFGAPKKPVNQVILGGLHTLHDKGGKRVGQTFWYEPERHNDHKTIDLSENSYATLQFAKKIRNKLKKHKYRSELEFAIIKYARALDTKDYNTAITKLWGVLEQLTYTQKENYDVTIRRVKFLFKDGEFHKQVLEHLRRYRNKLIHAGSHDEDIDAHIYQLKSYVERLLKFHISNHFKFESLEEAAKFMDLKPSRDHMQKQISLYRAGMRFIGG